MSWRYRFLEWVTLTVVLYNNITFGWSATWAIQPSIPAKINL